MCHGLGRCKKERGGIKRCIGRKEETQRNRNEIDAVLVLFLGYFLSFRHFTRGLLSGAQVMAGARGVGWGGWIELSPRKMLSLRDQALLALVVSSSLSLWSRSLSWRCAWRSKKCVRGMGLGESRLLLQRASPCFCTHHHLTATHSTHITPSTPSTYTRHRRIRP